MSDFLTSDRLPGLIQAAYIIAGILFIGALAGLSKHETAKRGNLLGMGGMALALVATLVLAARNSQYGDQRPLGVTLGLILVAMVVGPQGAIGRRRRRVEARATDATDVAENN